MAQIVGDLERLGHKLLDNVRVQPSSTQPYINFRCFQFSGLRFGQSLHIDLELRVAFSGKLSHAQFIPHIAGKILVLSLIHSSGTKRLVQMWIPVGKLVAEQAVQYLFLELL